MKYLIIFTIITFSIFNDLYSQVTFTGRITDKETGDGIFGATVYIPDLKVGVASDEKGNFSITDLPGRRFMVQLKSLGYLTINQMIDFSKVKHIEIGMETSAIEEKQVVVTGGDLSSDNNRTSVSINSIDKEEMKTIPSKNIIDEMSSLPGISEVTTGNNVSKPVIRGMSYSNIVTMNEGIRQEGNQWGDEHGVEIDQFSADRIEILKGPASLFYGSDALGGVINILEPVPPSPGVIGGDFISQYSTNNKLTANSLLLEGNNNGFFWQARGTYKNSASFQTPTEYVYNSGYNENDYSAMLGFNNRWGYTHLHFSRYDAHLGAVDSLKKNPVTGNFLDMNEKDVPENVLTGRKLELPFQHVIHTEITSVTNYIIKDSELKFTAGYEDNDRKEYDSEMSSPDLYMRLSTLTYYLQYIHPFKDSLEGVAGISGMSQFNRNKGITFLIPDYDLQDIGGFAYLKKSIRKFTVNAGIRFDTRFESGKALNLNKNGEASPTGDSVLFKSFNNNFHAFSGAAGMTYSISKLFNFKLNIGRGYRSPNIAELAENGVHEGTYRYEIGNPDLKAQTSLQFDGELSATTKYLEIVLSGFYNTIDNYIYPRNINNETKTVDGVTYPVYRFVQGNSLLKGYEFTVHIHPVEEIHFENSLSYVNGTNLQTHTPLPFIPALHTIHELKWVIKELQTKTIKKPFIRLNITNYFAQTRYDTFETETKGYVLYNAGLGTDIKIRNNTLTLFVNGDNITNRRYYDHLSRFKPLGIYNMGRNITFGVDFNFGISK